jgi:NTP pyrophosphatase (non-canonical NTP hydrolase)
MTIGGMTIGELQHIVHGWIAGTGGGYFSPITNAAVLAEETGEVARIMARRYGDQRPKPGDRTELSDLADELADLIWVAAAIANQTGIDLTDAIARNIEKKNLRDSDRFKK